MQDREHGDIWGCNAMQCNSGAAMQCNATSGIMQCNATLGLQCNAMQCNATLGMQCNATSGIIQNKEEIQVLVRLKYGRGDMETPSVASQCSAM